MIYVCTVSFETHGFYYEKGSKISGTIYDLLPAQYQNFFELEGDEDEPDMPTDSGL